MYRHLMVPVDDSMLSSANVGVALKLAASLDARITFFHATSDLGATGDGALLHAIAPIEFSEKAVGETHAVLRKAMSSAAAAGLQCETVSIICDRPAEAIVEAAQSKGCDLIVMASRGVRGFSGWLHNSSTERVLRLSPVALLVTRVASNDPLKPSERALAVLHDEHRSIAVVVRGMQDLVQEAQATGGTLDFQSLDAMLAYLKAFPLQLHHPKEEQFLHRWLRHRAPDCESLLLDLEAQHLREHALVDDAILRLKESKSSDTKAASQLGELVQTIAAGVWQHMRLEEGTLLPMAKKHFHEEDWEEIAIAFESNNDAGFGEMSADEFRRMFTRIANLLPAVAR